MTRFEPQDAAEDFLAWPRVEPSERRALGLSELQRVGVEDGIQRSLAGWKEPRRLGKQEPSSTDPPAQRARV